MAGSVMRVLAIVAVFAGFALSARATTFYVSAISGNDTNSGLSWAEAKQTIQGGVDAASTNDTVLVTNGVYNAGGKSAPGHSSVVTLTWSCIFSPPDWIVLPVGGEQDASKTKDRGRDC